MTVQIMRVSRLSVLIPRMILAIIRTSRTLLLKIKCKKKYLQIPDTVDQSVTTLLGPGTIYQSHYG